MHEDHLLASNSNDLFRAPLSLVKNNNLKLRATWFLGIQNMGRKLECILTNFVTGRPIHQACMRRRTSCVSTTTTTTPSTSVFFGQNYTYLHCFVSLLQIDDAHIYYNICFICLLASDPVLVIKLLNNLGAGNNTQMHKYSVRGCYSVDNSSTRTQVRAFHGCNLVDNTSTGAQV